MSFFIMPEQDTFIEPTSEFTESHSRSTQLLLGFKLGTPWTGCWFGAEKHTQMHTYAQLRCTVWPMKHVFTDMRHSTNNDSKLSVECHVSVCGLCVDLEYPSTFPVFIPPLAGISSSNLVAIISSDSYWIDNWYKKFVKFKAISLRTQKADCSNTRNII